MCLNVFLKRFLPFLLAAWCGSAAVYLISEPAYVPPVVEEFQIRGSGSWDGSAPVRRASSTDGNSKVFLISKPQAKYTDDARTNNTEGTVRLKVTLLASGQVGPIAALRELPDGLTEQAFTAARQIRFEPKMVNGAPVSTIVTINYSFSIY